MSEVPQGRKRSRLACETCRDLKRKCDGSQPCGTCVRFEYECIFPGGGRGKRRRMSKKDDRPTRQMPDTVAVSSPSQPSTTIAALPAPAEGSFSVAADPSSSHLRSLEANSGAAFVRRIALRLDPKNAPRMHMFAWNAFMGSRGQRSTHVATSRPITDMLSEAQMRDLANLYFQSVDIIYGFLERQEIEAQITRTWSSIRNGVGTDQTSLHDAVLCGIAALGYIFSQVEAPSIELDLVETARVLLDQTILEVPTVTAITAWILRVTYLRVAGTPHNTWMASCVLMHMIEAAGLHYESSPGESVLQSEFPQERIAPERRRRLVGVASHLNIWTSFDIGRSRVMLRNATNMMPSAQTGDYTLELMALLPYSAQLDPEKTPDATALMNALSAVMARPHTAPASVLGQINLALCLYRRLQLMNVALTGNMLDEMLALMTKGLQAAQANLDALHPWHHVANVPFQIICVLLSIDSVSVVSQLKDAMQCLSNVAAVYNTDATREATKTTSLLVLLHKRWREKAASDLGDVLDRFPLVSAAEAGKGSNSVRPGESTLAVQPEARSTSWLDSLEENLSNMQYFDIDQFFNGGFLGDTDAFAFQDISGS